MAVEHRNLPESGLHEPKGVSLAASNRVYISDGAGSGAWAPVDADALQGTLNNADVALQRVVTDGSGGFSVEPAAGRSRGSMTLTGNTTVVPMTAAVDTTLGSNSDYTTLNLAFGFNSTAGIVTGANYLEIVQAGTYLVDFWANAKAGNNNVTMALKFVVNDTDYITRRPKLRLPTAGQFDNFSANGFHTYQAGDQIKLAIASSVSTDITIEDLNFQIILVEGI